MLDERQDVVIVGAGPAGSMTGYHLARGGLRVLIIEAKTFPREKACGGGLQTRALRTIPLDVSAVVRGTISAVSLSSNLSQPQTRHYHLPLVYTVLRREFDELLLGAAETAGAMVLQGVTVRTINCRRDGTINIGTSNGTFKADGVIGADGANSVVRHLLNTRDRYFWQAAVYCEIPDEIMNTASVNMGAMRVDWGTLPSGYAWAFPKRGSLNVGAGGPVNVARGVKAYALRFLESIGVVKRGMLGRVNFMGHQLPTLTKRTKLAQGNLLLVGDAAGLVDPFTGDGISFACESAAIASRIVARALGSGSRDFSGYSDELMSTIGAEIIASRELLSLAVAFPGLMDRLFRTNEAVWTEFCRVLRGEASFEQLKKEVLGPFHVFSKAMNALSRRIEHHVMSKARFANSIGHNVAMDLAFDSGFPRARRGQWRLRSE